MPRWLPADADRWRLGAPGRPAGRDVTDRGHGQFPGQPAPGQVAADALVPARRQPAAPDPLRRLQRHARHWLRATLPRSQRPARAHDASRLTPNFATVPLSEVCACGCARSGALSEGATMTGVPRPIASATRLSGRLSAMPCASLLSELKLHGANNTTP